MPQTLRGSFEQALRPLPSVVKGVQACRLPGLKCSFEQALRPLPSVVKGVQACRLPGLKCLKRCAAASSRHSGHCPLLLSAFKPAVCLASNASNAARQLRHSGHCLSFARPQMPQTLCGSFEQALRPRSSLPFARPQMPQTLRGSFEQALRPLPSVVKRVQACRLPGLKCLKRCAAASTRHSGHCPLLLRVFKPAVCQASNASNAARQLRAGTQATALCC